MATTSSPTDPPTDPPTAPTSDPSTVTAPDAVSEVSSPAAPTGDAPSTTVEMSDLTPATHDAAEPAPSAPRPTPAAPTSADVTTAAKPAVHITLLLTSGARHALHVDAAALAARGLATEDGDPFGISVYQLKELIWQDWKVEWEARPAAPGAIRLIHFGRMLEDKMVLKECRFNAESPNVVHMTVRPQEMVEEEDTKAAKLAARERDAESRESTRCCVIL